MSQDRYLQEEPGHAGGPRCSLKHAQEARKNYCGTVRPPLEPDEQGAVNVVELLFAGRDRLAFFLIAGSEQCGVVFLDRPSPPGAHASAESLPSAPKPRQSGEVLRKDSRVHQVTSDAGPLFGTPGCAAPLCDPAPAAVPAAALRLVCARCGAKPKPDTLALEGGTHWLIRSRNDASRPGPAFTRTHPCGKWRRT